jgi:hypothetical protein
MLDRLNEQLDYFADLHGVYKVPSMPIILLFPPRFRVLALVAFCTILLDC